MHGHYPNMPITSPHLTHPAHGVVPMYPVSGLDPLFTRPVVLARAYIPYQYYTRAYTPEMAIETGTLFPELYHPYIEKRK